MSQNLLKTRKTTNGYTVNLLKIGTMYYVQTLHEKRRGYGTRYAGTSKEKAEKAFAK